MQEDIDYGLVISTNKITTSASNYLEAAKLKRESLDSELITELDSYKARIKELERYIDTLQDAVIVSSQKLMEQKKQIADLTEKLNELYYKRG